jgi:type II secretory pathway pseudopilin PulG
MRRKSFTLIELLVVIVILMILAGILLPVLLKIKVQRDRIKTKEQAYQLYTAWTAYLTDYRAFPSGTYTNMDTNSMNVLNGRLHNSLGNVYMEFTTNEWNNGYRDPWGSFFMLALDTNYDYRVTAGLHGVIPKVVAIWSLGPDRSNADSGALIDDAKSW